MAKMHQIPEGGVRNTRQEWRPLASIQYAPIFSGPTDFKKNFKWIFGLPGFLWPWNMIYLSITLISWNFLQPPMSACKSFAWPWMLQIYARNFVLLWLVYGAWHFYLYTLKARGTYRKYCPRWQSTQGSTFLFGNQVFDNIFWCLTSGCGAWTAYECVSFWAYANGYMPYLDPREHPILFVLGFLAIPFWREFHFYWIHRLIHWKPIYNISHYLHHYNINPGPWSGLAMHPIESIGYFSVVLIHWIIPSHPLHFLFNAQHTALTPAHSHTGFEGSLDKKSVLPFGSYFHYLHHRYFDCNYGESTLPLDKWFGSFMANEDSKNSTSTSFQKVRLIKIETLCDSIKSFTFKREDEKSVIPHRAGQFMLFKFKPQAEEKPVMRSYTISDTAQPDTFRISVKKEEQGLVSRYLHQEIRIGDLVEAKGPQGSFVVDSGDSSPLVFCAAGIGITPLYAMLKDLCQQGSQRQMFFFAIMKHAKQYPFKAELEAWQATLPNLQVVTFYSQGDTSCEAENIYVGRPQLNQIQAIIAAKSKNSLAQHQWMICGPNAFMAQLSQDLLGQNVPLAHIQQEAFGPGQQIKPAPRSLVEKQNSIVIHFKKSGKSLEWDNESQNLLAFAEEHDIPMEAGCLFGECGSCKVDVDFGEVEYNYKTAYKTDCKSCLPCSCRPKSNITLNA